ncbi:MAG: caspase family protein [Vicinamibacterales bacterium]
MKETLTDILGEIVGLGPGRGITETVTDLSDATLESAFRNGGFALWTNMKRSAELAFLPRQGGMFVVERLVELWRAHSHEMEIHAIGHSAGSIFHARFLEALCQQPTNPPVTIESLHFLAPAITVALFKETLLPLVGGRIKRLTEFTMHKDFELADSVGPYRKSLLYLVSRAFEDAPETPLLGLEESIRRDPELMRAFGLFGRQPKAEVLFSVSEEGPSRSTIARSHGDFDNDRLTMAGVMRRILQVAADVPIVEFPEVVSRTILDTPPAPKTAPVVAPPRLAAAPVQGPGPGPTGRRRALCVGIDEYDAPNQLAGCVNDARDWATALRGLGFDTRLLANREATWKGISDALKELIESSQSGDTLVFQCASHGTLVPDLDGDERSGQDSALCPVDFPSGGFLIDDDLRRIFQRLPDGVSLTCFFDCCHSGTITRLVASAEPTRDGGDVRVRGLVATPEMVQAHRRFRSRLGGLAPKRRGPDTMREVSFTACSDAQTAQEIDGHGLFTVRALGVLGRGVERVTNEQFHWRVIEAFGPNAQQTPQLDCADAKKGHPIFGAAPPASSDERTSAGDVTRVLARLDDIERRLAALGA